MSADDLLLVAGEASGDLHAARLLAEVRQRRPSVRPFGLGGEEVRAAGLEAVSDDDIAVVGIVEVLKVLPRARRVFRRLLEEVDRRQPAVAVLVDFPEFNLRLAAELNRRGIRVVYYISPQVWAWRRGRVRKIARLVDRMLVFFPFEVDFYSGHGVDVHHVGHPLVDEVPRLTQVWSRGPVVQGPYHLALLPGSRPSEVEALLPGMLEAVRILSRELPLYVRLIRAPTIPEELLERHLEDHQMPLEVVSQRRFEVIADSHLALCASGTATLETGLLGTPMIVLYRLAGWTYVLARLLVRLPHFSLVNLVLGRGVVPELVQRGARPGVVAAKAANLLRDTEAVDAMRRGLAELRDRLGDGGASGRAAEQVVATMEETEG